MARKVGVGGGVTSARASAVDPREVLGVISTTPGALPLNDFLKQNSQRTRSYTRPLQDIYDIYGRVSVDPSIALARKSMYAVFTKYGIIVKVLLGLLLVLDTGAADQPERAVLLL